MITQKHLTALDCLRQFASEHPGLFRAFLLDSSIPEEEANKVSVEQIKLAEELHLDIAKINYELQELMVYLHLVSTKGSHAEVAISSLEKIAKHPFYPVLNREVPPAMITIDHSESLKVFDEKFRKKRTQPDADF